jgi:hypothetical protein
VEVCVFPAAARKAAIKWVRKLDAKEAA